MKTVLVDGNNLLWRCVHVTAGEPVNSVRASKLLLGMIARAADVAANESTYEVILAWDDETPLRRIEMYSGYQQKRRTQPNPLRQNAACTRRLVQIVLRELGVRQVYSPGWEADDVIGTITAAPGDYTIVSNDRDLFQLLAPNVAILQPQNGGGLLTVREPECEARLGVLPNQVADLKSLTGDTSDEVPGVPGVGPVTAKKLLDQYKTVEQVLHAAFDGHHGMTRKLAEKLREHEQAVFRNRGLVTIRRAVELHHQRQPGHLSVARSVLQRVGLDLSEQVLFSLYQPTPQ